MTTTKYDSDVVNVFYNFKEQNLVAKYTEEASLRAILGNDHLKNLSILDIGCGFGYHSRWLADEGALVTGVDLSEDQIRLAMQIELDTPRGIRFGVDDASRLNLENDLRYDVCIMMYMLQSAQDEQQLFTYIQNAFWRLKNGGKLIGVFNSCYDTSIAGKYGYKFDRSALEAEPGQMFIGETEVDSGQSAFVCRQIKVDRRLIQNLGESAGFRNVIWCNPTVSKKGLALMGEEFWCDFVYQPVDQYFVMNKIDG